MKSAKFPCTCRPNCSASCRRKRSTGSAAVAPVKIDVHVLATTNRSLKQAVADGTFREDLYYRLNVIPLTLPPLEPGVGDLHLLTEYFIDKYSTLYKTPKKKLSPASIRRFEQYQWPGNVRELENLIERAVSA